MNLRKSWCVGLLVVVTAVLCFTCEGGFVDETVKVTFEDNTGSDNVVGSVEYNIRDGGVWTPVKWTKNTEKEFRVNKGDYTFGLFPETGPHQHYAEKKVTIDGDCELIFEPADLLE